MINGILFKISGGFPDTEYAFIKEIFLKTLGIIQGLWWI